MTNEEIKELKGLAASIGLYDDKNPCKRAMILGKAIKALEQEPCEDAINRQAVLDLIADYDLSMGQVVNCIYALPPVMPQPKTGHWIESRDSYGNNHFTCPFCEHDIATKSDIWEDNYCSNCGAKMSEITTGSGSEEEDGRNN